MKRPHPVLAAICAFVAVAVITDSLAAAAMQQLVVPPLPDPSANPSGAVDTVTALWDSGLFVSSVIVGTYLLLVWLTRWVPWLTEGKRAAYSSAALGFLSMLAVPAAAGSPITPAMVAAAVLTTATLFLSPKPGEVLHSKGEQ